MRILVVRRRDLVCQQVVEMVTAYLEEALSRSDRRRLEKHLAGCPHCTEYIAQIRETIRLAGRLAPEDLTPRMRSDLTEVYRHWRAELSVLSAPGPACPALGRDHDDRSGGARLAVLPVFFRE